MKCAIGGEADIPATRRFFVQGQHAQGDRHLYASGRHFMPELTHRRRAGIQLLVKPSK